MKHPLSNGDGTIPVLSTKIRDWRIEDARARTSAEIAAVEGLENPEHRAEWSCKVSESAAFNGVSVEFTSPDGRTSLVEFELDQGRIAVAMRPEKHGDILVKAFVGADAIVVSPQIAPGDTVTGLEGKSFAFDADGRTRVVADPESN